jgi:hypothetical protein
MEIEETAPGDWSDEAAAPEISRGDVALRALYSLLFGLIISLLESLLFVVVIFQLLYSLVTEKLPSSRVQAFGNGITAYFYQMLRYLTHNDSVIPFPFSDLPAPREPSRPAYAPHRAETDAGDEFA